MAVKFDQALLSEVQFGVIEAPDEGATFPSGLWTPAEVLAYANLRQRRFVKKTKLHIGRAPFTLAANTERPDLDALLLIDIIQIVRVALVDANGVFQEIPISDLFAADSAIPDWSLTASAQAVPDACSVTDAPHLSMVFMPALSVARTVWLHFVPNPPTLDLVGDGTGDGERLAVALEFALGIKWGIWADMLGKPGLAFDAQRAAYAEQRYAEIEDLAMRLVNGLEGA